MPEISEHGAARHRVGGHPGGRGKSRIGQNVVVQNDLSGNGGGVTWEWGRAGGTSRIGRVPGGQGEWVAANDRDDGTEDKGDDSRRRMQSRGNSSGACGVADIAGAAGARVRVSGHAFATVHTQARLARDDVTGPGRSGDNLT